jgi:flagellar biosynthesis protein FlhB
MAEEEEQSSKTEEATEQKLRKSRTKGDVPSSREPSVAMSVIALFVIVFYLAPGVMTNLGGALTGLIDMAGAIEVGEGRTGLRDLEAVSEPLAWAVAAILAPVMGVMIFAAVFGMIVQGETVVALERIKPKLSKVSPQAGFKRLFSIDALVEFGKSLAKVAVVAGIAGWIGSRVVTSMWEAPLFLPESLLGYSGSAAARILLVSGTVLAAIAVLDVIWKRAQWLKKQRMTLRELRDEHKDTEGDPFIRAKRAGIRRQRARQRISAAVPTATVVIANPTHFAVALRYELGRDAAPTCVAKGTDRVAARIREIAREAGVPIVENRPLARILHATVEVDDPVPVEHWKAVAEIIAYVMDLRRNLDRQPPEGSRLRLDD